MLNEAVELLFELEEWDQAAEVTLEEIAPRLDPAGPGARPGGVDRPAAAGRALAAPAPPGLARPRRPTSSRSSTRRCASSRTRSACCARQNDTRGLVEALFVRGEAQRLKGYNDEALATFDEARALLGCERR